RACFCFLLRVTAPPPPYPLSLHDALPIFVTETSLDPLLQLIAERLRELLDARLVVIARPAVDGGMTVAAAAGEHAEATRAHPDRSEEHTSELQSLAYLVCRLLLEKKKYYC